jgi:hypothetical protein
MVDFHKGKHPWAKKFCVFVKVYVTFYKLQTTSKHHSPSNRNNSEHDLHLSIYLNIKIIFMSNQGGGEGEDMMWLHGERERLFSYKRLRSGTLPYDQHVPRV